MLQRDAIEGKKKKFVDIIESSSQHLLTLVNNVLDYEKSIAGRIVLDDSKLDIREIADKIFSMVGGDIGNKSVELGFDINADIPKELYGDEMKLKQILMNLLSNALKFTEQGSVRLKVALEKANEEKQEHCFSLLFEVSDTGIGISDEAQKKIFEDFTQADSSTTRHYGGTGLGLSICKAYIELMGGSIWVESKQGEGSKFIFTIPFYNLPEKERFRDKLQECEGVKFTGLQVLVAENNSERIESFRDLLGSLDCHFGVIHQGDELAEQLTKKQYDICFICLELPRLSGAAAIRKVREEVNKEIPIIVIATASFFEDKSHCIEIGANDFISVPISEDKLKEKLIIYTKKQ